jgi:hypothetical protein
MLRLVGASGTSWSSFSICMLDLILIDRISILILQTLSTENLANTFVTSWFAIFGFEAIFWRFNGVFRGCEDKFSQFYKTWSIRFFELEHESNDLNNMV